MNGVGSTFSMEIASSCESLATPFAHAVPKHFLLAQWIRMKGSDAERRNALNLNLKLTEQ